MRRGRRSGEGIEEKAGSEGQQEDRSHVQLQSLGRQGWRAYALPESAPVTSRGAAAEYRGQGPGGAE